MTTNIVTRRDFLKIISVLAGAVAGNNLIATGQAVFDVPVAVPNIWDGNWHTVRVINKAGVLSVGIDRELFQSAEAIRDIREITKPLDRGFSMGGKTIHQLIGDGNGKETVFVKFDFRSSPGEESSYFDDIYYDPTGEYPEVLTTSTGINVIQAGFEYGDALVDPGAPAIG